MTHILTMIWGLVANIIAKTERKRSMKRYDFTPGDAGESGSSVARG